MATVDELLIELRADTKKLQADMRKATGQVEDFSKKSQKHTKDVSAGFSNMGNVIKLAVGSVAVKSFIDLARQMQNLEARLKAATGSVEAASQAMTLLRQMSNEQSVVLTDLADGFTRLLPAVKSGQISFEQMREVLTLANDNIKAFGLSASESQSLFLGLSQALGSGTVTMEDLRQVTDRLPGTLSSMATAMNMSVGEFKDFIATGTATAEEVMPAMLAAFRENEGAAADMANTFDSQMARMQNAFLDLADAVADTGIMDALSAAIGEVGNAITVLNTIILKYRQQIASLTGDSEAYIKITKEYNAALDRLSGHSDAATGELEKLGKGAKGAGKGKGEASKEAKKLAKEIEKVESKLTDLNKKAIKELVTTGMSDLEKSLYEVDIVAARLAQTTGGLTEKQRDWIETVKHNVKAAGQAKEAYEAQQEAQEQLAQEQERYAEMMREPFENAMEGIQDVVTDTFEGIFDGSIDSAGDAADAIKRIFIRMAAEIATLELLNATGLTDSVARSAGALGGASQGMLSGTTSSGFGLSDLSNLSSLTGGFNQSVFAGTALGSAIDTFAFNNLGIGQSVAQANAVLGVPSIDPSIAGSTFSGQGGITANFTPANMLGGFAGNMGANLLFGDDRGIGASIGGGLGGIAGGAALSAPLTAALGAIGGPLGFAIGAFAGNAIGGLFGNNKPSDKGQWATANLSGAVFEQGGLTGDKFSQENRDAAIALSQLAGNITDLLDDIEGVNSNFDRVRVKFGNRDSNFIAFGTGDIETEDIQFTGRSQEALMNAMIEGIVGGLDNLPSELADALRRVDFSGDLNDALADVQFIAGFEDMIDVLANGEKPVDEYEQAMKALNDTLAAGRERAERLGLSLTEYDEAAEQARKRTEQLIEAQRNANDPLRQALENAAQSAMQMAESFAQINADLQRTLDSFNFGADSAMSPEGQLALAERRFEMVAKQARLGDLEALRELPSVATLFRNEGRDFFGSSAQFKNIDARVQGALLSASDVATRQIGAQASAVESFREDAPATASVAQAIRALAQEQAVQNKQMQSVLTDINVNMAARRA